MHNKTHAHAKKMKKNAAAAAASTTARGRKPTATAPPPAKRGQKRQYAQEFDPVTGELLSMETRARRAREILHLREENNSLKEERTQFLTTIDTLTSQLVSFTKDVPPEVREDNQILKKEIELHVEFISAFQDVLAEEAKAEQQAKHALYSQGGEAAEGFLLGILNESSQFQKAELPPGMELPMIDLEFRFAFQRVMFGKEEGVRRLSLRLDAFVPRPATAESVQHLFSRALMNAKDMQRLYGIQDKPMWNLCPLDKLDEKTQLMYFRRSADVGEAQDQFSVFICHQSEQEMAKSTLLPPVSVVTGDANSEQLEGDKVYGTVQAKLVSMTTTTLLEMDPCVSVGNTDHSYRHSAVPVSGMVLKGVVAYDDAECNGVRFVVVYSVPEDYKIINKLSFNDIVQEEDSTAAAAATAKTKKRTKHGGAGEVHMTPKFAQVLIGVAQEFTSMMRESGVDLPANANV